MRKRDEQPDEQVYISEENDRGRKRWRVTHVQWLPDDTKPSGWRRLRTPQTFRDEASARACFDEIKRESRGRRALTVGDMIDAYCEHVEQLGRDPGTVARYRRWTSDLCDPDVQARLVTLEMAREWYRTYREANIGTDDKPRTRAVSSQQMALQVTKAMWRWAADESMVPRTPFAKVAPSGRRRKGGSKLHVDEARLLLAEAMRRIHPTSIGRYTQARRMGALGAAVALLCGLRSGEVRALCGRDVDDEGRLLWVADGEDDGKTDNAERIRDVPTQLQPALRRLAEQVGPGGPLFPRSEQWLVYHCERLCKAAGVRRVTPHGLRRTFSTVGRGARGIRSQDVADAIGHGGASGTRVAEDHYIGRGTAARADQAAVAEVLALHRPCTPKSGAKDAG